MNQTSPETASAKQPLFYYGWIIIFVAFITLGVAFGIWYSYSVFILAVVDDFGWSMASASSVFSIFIISHSTFAMAGGYLQDRFGPRIVVPAGALIVSMALIAASMSQNLWHFQISYGVIGGGGISLLGFVSHSAFLPKWFERKRGLALGIAMAGIGLGMLLIVPFAEKLISLYEWRNAYRALAAIVLFFIAPLNLVFGRKSPEAVSQYPDGDISDKQGPKKTYKWTMLIIDEKWANINWSFKKAFKTLRFWYLVFAFFFISFAFQGILLHAVSAMVDSGMSRSAASYFFGMAGIMGSAGKILFGYVSDMLGRERAKLIGDATALVGIMSLMLVSLVHGPMALGFALFFGLGYGATAPLMPAITADIFMGKNYGLIFSIIATGGGLGAATGTYVNGLLRDITGTYFVSFSVCSIFLIVSCILVFLASPGKIRKMIKHGGRS
ncbi:MAG: MFS transporter [Desulfobacterales bacterium]